MTTTAPAPLVAHVIFKLDFGGLENGLVNVINGMAPGRFRHAIVCLAGFGQQFRSRIRRDDVEVISVDKRPGKDFGAYGRVWRTLRRLRPAIVHTRNLGTIDMQWVALAAGVPHRVHGEHGWEASDPAGRNPRNLAIRRACRPVIDRYVPMSRDLARWLEHDVRVPPEKIRQLYNGVDTGRFTPAGDRESTPDPTITIGTIGRLDPVKNQAALLRAVHLLIVAEPQLRSRLRLLVVGDGPLRESLQSLAVELGIAAQVEFAGACNDTPAMLRRMDIFVLPSLNEGISNTILEAMATALPVIAGHVGGNPELVEHGKTGQLYNVQDGDALPQLMRAYVDDAGLCRGHGRAGRQRVLKEFRLDSMVDRYLDLYTELAGGGS